MIKILSIVIALSFVSNMSMKKKKILFFGDSITRNGELEDGYITQLNKIAQLESMSEKVEFVGKGIGGNKVYDLYLRMQEDVIAQNPDIVFIYIGVNDVWHKQSYGTGTDADKFEKFYQAIIDSLQSKNIELILCTPGVIGEKTDFSNSLDGDMNQYSKIIDDLALKNGIVLCNLRGEMLKYNQANNPENLEKGILTKDRVHLNEMGNTLVANTFWKIIKERI